MTVHARASARAIHAPRFDLPLLPKGAEGLVNLLSVLGDKSLGGWPSELSPSSHGLPRAPKRVTRAFVLASPGSFLPPYGLRRSGPRENGSRRACFLRLTRLTPHRGRVDGDACTESSPAPGGTAPRTPWGPAWCCRSAGVSLVRCESFQCTRARDWRG